MTRRRRQSRNVEVLATLIEQHLPECDLSVVGCQFLADRLAQAGVLAVDALTDEQVSQMEREIAPRDCGWAHERVRPALRRCATGEQDEAR